MPAQNHHISMPARARRAACAVAGIFFLLLQLIAPAMAQSGDSMWIEICADGGAVWVEVDLDEDTDPTAPCPNCADCALCAVTGAAPLPDLPQVGRVQSAQDALSGIREAIALPAMARLWPETRGPPCAPEHQTERAPRASMASIQVIGGAPWS